MTRVHWVLVGLLFLRLFHHFATSPRFDLGMPVEISGRIDSEPTIGRGRQVFKIDQFQVVTSTQKAVHFGDRVAVKGVAGYGNRVDEAVVVLTEKYVPNPWEKAALSLRSKFITTYQNVLPSQEASLLSGVVLGSVGLDRQFKSKLADVGLTHVVAASGMNITLFSGFVAWLLAVVRLGRGAKALLSAGFIVFYSTITGFEPPVVRASLMAGMVIFATVLGRQGGAIWSLAISAFLMLWVSPSLLVNASFLLSFFSMMSQIFLGAFFLNVPKSRKLIMTILGGIKGIFWQSFLAIVFTLPIVVWFFSKFSLISLLSNMLTLWTIEPLMVLGGIMGIVGIISQDFAKVVALPAGPLLAYFLGVVDTLSGKDYLVMNLKISSWLFPVGYYFLLAGFVWWWQGGKIKT